MNIIESNKEIAKMLGWIDADGDLVVPNHLSNGYNYSEWADTKYIKRDDLYKGCTICHYINVTQEGFSSDWNWLMSAVDFIRNNGYRVTISDEQVEIGLKLPNIKEESDKYTKIIMDELFGNSFFIKVEGSSITSTFSAVSKFAKKYNNKEL